jgi:hypothetical protein
VYRFVSGTIATFIGPVHVYRDADLYKESLKFDCSVLEDEGGGGGIRYGLGFVSVLKDFLASLCFTWYFPVE